MNKEELQTAVTPIGLYLSANHDCIAIDDGTEESRQIEWRVDNSKAISALEMLAAHLGVQNGVMPEAES